jgi:hypothetical protein
MFADELISITGDSEEREAYLFPWDLLLVARWLILSVDWKEDVESER